MAEEPDNLVLRLLREIRSSQVAQGEVLGEQGSTLRDQGATLVRLEKRVEDLYKISTHTLGVTVTAHERYEALETRVDRLSERMDRLEAKQ